MKKKDLEKLINSQNIENKFNEINKKIDYSKYEKVPAKTRVFRVGFKHCLAGVFALLVLTLSSNYVYCSIHNKLIDKRIEEAYKSKLELKKVETIAEYNKALTSDVVSIKNSKLTPWVESLFEEMSPKNEFPPALSGGNDVNSGVIYQPEDNEGNNQISTNVQVKGIDEADVSKCDGEYIYAAYNDCVMIFDLNGNIVDQETYLENDTLKISNPNLYVEDENVIVTSEKFTRLYEFENNDLKLKYTFEYEDYLDSRLEDGNLYLIVRNQAQDKKDIDGDVYYTVGSKATARYEIYKYDLETNELKITTNLNTGNAILYMSNNHIYLATKIYYYAEGSSGYYVVTVASIFDKNLEPVGAIKLEGSVLNQFSMDEYNGYFRVVTTQEKRVANKMNHIAIYSLDSLKRVGFLGEGIGEDYQSVKSVSFSENKCHVVTYETKDPLYEIDLSDVTNPKIVSVYKAPGYSSYLQKFEINGEPYLFGLGYGDESYERKISIYKETEEGTVQIGEDFLMSTINITASNYDLILKDYNPSSFDHKALFVYEKDDVLYLGTKLEKDKYYIFKIDVNSNVVISNYCILESNDRYDDSRCYLIDGKLLITDYHDIVIYSFE